MAPGERTTRRVYSAEQLHQLRTTSSAPKLQEAIEEHDGDDAEVVKEHVLRGSKSFAARSLRSRAPLSSLQFRPPRGNNENVAATADTTHEPTPLVVASAPAVLGEIPNNGQLLHQGPWRLRRSPTPSIRKKRVEDLVKHHGSPRHVRVTAGGRIVPSEQSPLCHPRFGYSAIKTNGGLVKVVPNHNNSKAQWTNATQDGFIAQDVDGRLCQIVNGTIMPLQEQDGMLRLYVSAPNLNMTPRGSSLTGFVAPTDHSNTKDEQLSNLPAAPQPTVAAQKNGLELEYTKLEHELKDLDKTEVLHGRTMGKVAKDALIGKRRELVTSMDRIRKAIKSLNELPQDAQIPTSPKAMRQQQTVPPPPDRLPTFLGNFRQSNNAGQPPQHLGVASFNHPYFGAVMSQQPAGSFGYPTMHGPDANFMAMPYPVPQPGFFMEPPSFDGSMAPYPMYSPPIATAPAVPQQRSIGPDTSERRDSANDNIPQSDGSAAVPTSPPRQSHAVTVKDPETKKVMNIKSMLNPMSPIYKPRNSLRQAPDTVKSEKEPAAAPKIPLMHNGSHMAKSSGPQGNGSVSPTKKKVVITSSSVSSIKTADFFPRNTREYSSRKHEYPTPRDDSEDKENAAPEQHNTDRSASPSPVTPKRGLHNTNWNPDIPDAAFVKFTSPRTGSYAAPTVPPGTPVNTLAGSSQGQHLLQIERADWHRRGPSAVPELEVEETPDRSAHNLSPKSKRNSWQFVQEDPRDYSSATEVSSPMKEQDRRDELCVVNSPITKPAVQQHSQTWMEGYQAGLHRRSVGQHRMGDYLAGYCAGLMESQAATTASTDVQNSSPVKPISRRPSPAQAPPTSGSSLTAALPKAVRPPFELNMHSMDTLKQAVFAPQNENAVLTPTADGPLAGEAPPNRGAWIKRHQNAAAPASYNSTAYPFPQRVSSAADRQVSGNDGAYEHASARHDTGTESSRPIGAKTVQEDKALPLPPRLAQSKPRTASVELPNERLNSLTSIDSTLYRPWPTNANSRILSASDWKSHNAAAGISTAYFAHAQFDGTPDHDPALLASRLMNAGGRSQPPAEPYSRFREASLDGMSSPPASPRAASPVSDAAKLSPRAAPPHSKRHSPGKQERVLSGKSVASTSPTKAKFESLAGKVGIKVGGETSPPGKKGWRSMWRAAKEEGKGSGV